MVALSALWIPILLSAIIVFVLSSLIHMATPWHKDDFRRLPDEDRVLDALRGFSLPTGTYTLPRPASRNEMNSPAWAEKVRRGPNLMLQVMRNEPMSMGRNLGAWFLYSIVIGIFAAYVAGRALGPGAPYLSVFRFAGTTAFLGYTAALWQLSIWYQRPLLTTMKTTVDGLIYALFTAGTFGWLWPR